MSEPTHPPITHEPRSVRPPYDVRDDSLDGIADTEAWRRARHLNRAAALREPLVGLEVTEYEHRLLEHLARRDTDEIAVVAALLWRCREASCGAAHDGSVALRRGGRGAPRRPGRVCPRCQQADAADLGGYLECRGCGRGWADDTSGSTRGGEA